MVFESANSKIVCTIGPASKSKEVLAKMVDAGMDVARLNFSHEDRTTAKATFDTIRSVDDTIPILFDLQGPKIRIGEMKEPAIFGAECTLTLCIITTSRPITHCLYGEH